MKPTTSIPLMLATALVLGTAGAVATAQDNGNETINEQLLAEEGAVDGTEKGPRHDKGQHGKQKMSQEKHHGKRGHGHDNDGERDGERDGRQGKRGHGGPGMMQKLFTTVDANADGEVTQEEIDAFRSTQLSNADENADGALSIEEFDTIYRALTRSRMVDMFQDFDEDGDGIVSPAEMDERFGKVVERMDRNDDGVLSAEDGKQRRGGQ